MSGMPPRVFFNSYISSLFYFGRVNSCKRHLYLPPVFPSTPRKSSTISTPAGTLRSASPPLLSRNSSATTTNITNTSSRSLSSVNLAATPAKMEALSPDQPRGYSQDYHGTIHQPHLTESISKHDLRGHHVLKEPAANKGRSSVI